MTIAELSSMFLSFAIGLICLPFLIRFLNKEKVDQTERSYIKSHEKKNGTPTMGGIAILLAVTISSIVYSFTNPKIIPVLILTLGFGLIGFIDDFMKVILHRVDGLKAWQKLLLQIVVTAVFAYYITHFSHVSLELIIPFTGGHRVNIGWAAIPILFFAVIGTVNGTNFTDGLDGLASTVTLVVSFFFAAASVRLGGGVEVMGLIMAGALMAFLCFNCHPAKVFMGDTGSLALGGFVAGMAYMMQMPLFILIVGFIYLIEVLSVIIQVTYFKATHGKRIFRMTPIHHHFELGGWSETKVVTIFGIITVLLSFLAWMAM
ncbi:MAG: phospho-N-acetylmuramoyl-pentapeptide-transferase [Lachnospiraceae bacterium]|nr:phospho-N-acetylmuramoyl-pentapeptide-transferase [Lachnospiraceae bacterium]